VINNFHTGLGLWKGRLLSMARKVCLIKIVLSSLPLYYMSVFLMPKQVEVARVINSIKIRFLLSGDSSVKRIYKVAWKVVVGGEIEGVWALAHCKKKYIFYFK
jgi:hypothetical protein